MKIAHITIYPAKNSKHVNASGVASYTKNLLENISVDTRDEVYVLCEKQGGVTDRYEEDGVTVIRCFDRSPGFIWQLHQELKTLQPDVIHIQQELALFGNVITAYLLQWLVRWWHERIVITLHGVVSIKSINKDFVRQNNADLPVWLVKLAFKVIYAPLAKWTSRIIVHETYFKNILVEEYGASPEKVAVIHHGVEDLHIIEQSTARKKIKVPPDAQVALYMGYLTGYKGIDLLIEGFAMHCKNNPKAFLIIGAGKHPKLEHDETYLAEYTRLQQKTNDLIPTQNYQWVGFIAEPDIPLYYSASDVSIYPYTVAMSSSGPMSFAIGFEKPFLASTVFADVFADYPQLLFNRKPDALAAKLDAFFKDQQAFNKISQQLKKERLWQKVGEQTKMLYAEVAGGA
ncbi:MAG: glycosyltransferase [Candidatus Saccharimonadales bacterium]